MIQRSAFKFPSHTYKDGYFLKILMLALIMFSLSAFANEEKSIPSDKKKISYMAGYEKGVEMAELKDSDAYFIMGIISVLFYPPISGLASLIFAFFEKIKYPVEINGEYEEYAEGFKNGYSKQIRIRKLKSVIQGNILAFGLYLTLAMILTSTLFALFMIAI